MLPLHRARWKEQAVEKDKPSQWTRRQLEKTRGPPLVSINSVETSHHNDQRRGLLPFRSESPASCQPRLHVKERHPYSHRPKKVCLATYDTGHTEDGRRTRGATANKSQRSVCTRMMSPVRRQTGKHHYQSTAISKRTTRAGHTLGDT